MEPFLIQLLFQERYAALIPKKHFEETPSRRHPISLHDKRYYGHDNETALEDLLPDPNTPTPEQHVIRDEKSARVHADILEISLSLKTEKEHQILKGLLEDFSKEEWAQLQQEHSITGSQLKAKKTKF